MLKTKKKTTTRRSNHRRQSDDSEQEINDNKSEESVEPVPPSEQPESSNGVDNGDNQNQVIRTKHHKKHRKRSTVKRGNDAPMPFIKIGDDPSNLTLFNNVESDEYIHSRLFGQTSTPHHCNPQCIKMSYPSSLSPEEQLARLRLVNNPFLVPMVIYDFIRTAILMKPGSKCLLCSALKDDESCPKVHMTYVTPCGKVLWCPEHVRRFLLVAGSKATMHLNENFFTFSELFQLKQAVVEAYEYIPDISYGLESVPVSLVNTVKGLETPKFRYNNARFFDSEITDRPDNSKEWMTEFKSCCSCKDNCISNKCECKVLTKTENCGKPGYQHRRLYSHLKRGVFECNSGCPCNAACSNRVSQNGILCRMQFFPCGKKGWGVRTLHFIPKGMFIATYNGRIIESLQIDPRNKSQSQYIADLYVDINSEDAESPTRTMKQNYTVNASKRLARAEQEQESEQERELDPEPVSSSENIFQEGTSQETPPLPPSLSRDELFREDRRDFLVDGSAEGNVARSFNHSCSPNLFAQPIFTETHDMRFYEMALFALRDIHPMEELCWNYSYRMGRDNQRVLYCQCASLNCNIRLI